MNGNGNQNLTMLVKDQNEDPDRAERIRKLREEERRLAEQVRREREIRRKPETVKFCSTYYSS